MRMFETIVTINRLTVMLLLVCQCATGTVAGGTGPPGRTSALTPAVYSSKTRLNINRISTVISNQGILDINMDESNSGLVYPKGTGKTAVYESGLLWGAGVGGGVRVGGSAYRTGLQPGRILSTGVAESPDLPKNRIYRVRPDYATAFLETELFEEMLHEDTIRAHYRNDWMEWPAAEGAPFSDANGDGFYNPAIDTPGVPGAGQTIWYVANDLDSNLTVNLYGSAPMGIEAQVTVWAYADGGAVGNSFFRKYRLINKSASTFDSMYVSAWADPDIGNAVDDYVGCDTTLDIAYGYNANAADGTYNPLNPPSVGFHLLRGPLVESPGDTGIFEGRRIAGRRNLRMSAFYYFARGDASVTDPIQGSYQGTTQFYNFFRGRIGLSGGDYIDPNTFQPTTFPLAGDPVTGQGWVDGQSLAAGDRRMGLVSGPFTMAPGDSQEVVVAEILAGATPGVDRLSAVGYMKFNTAQVRSFFDEHFVITGVPEHRTETPRTFLLGQNYPNPFNPVTRISYQIPRDGRVILAVYNPVGQRVALLVDEVQREGTHVAMLDASGIPSGVYLYRLTVAGADFTRKMVVIR